MTVAAPQRIHRPLRFGALAAVIAEARRRARRRRRRYAACILLGALAVVGAMNILERSAGGTSPPQELRPSSAAARVTPSLANGPLTVIVAERKWGGIYTVGRQGLGRLVVPCSNGTQDCHSLHSAAWSPDGSRIAYFVTSYGRDASAPDGLHLLNPFTGEDRKLPTSVDWRNITWSRDGARLAGNTDLRAITLMNADGTGERVLQTGTEGRDSSPSWAPNGQRLAYASKANGYWSVYVINLDGTHRRLLASHASAPAWAPQGKEIAVRTAGGIELVTPAGEPLRPRAGLAPGTRIGISGPPVWSPDGREIAVARSHSGVYLLHADGTRLVRLTTQAGHLEGPRFSQQRLAWQPLAALVSRTGLIGTWQRVNTCSNVLRALRRSGFAEFAPIVIQGGGYRKGTVQQIAHDSSPCRGARPLKHSHAFYANGTFASFDAAGKQVDDQFYRIVSSNTFVIGPKAGLKAATVQFRLSANTIRFSVVIPRPCTTKWCRESTAWAISAFFPGTFMRAG